MCTFAGEMTVRYAEVLKFTGLKGEASPLNLRKEHCLWTSLGLKLHMVPSSHSHMVSPNNNVAGSVS